MSDLLHVYSGHLVVTVKRRTLPWVRYLAQK